MPKALHKRLFVAALLMIYGMILVLNLLTPLNADDYIYMYHITEVKPIASLADLVSSAKIHYQWMNGRVLGNTVLTPVMLLLGQRVFHFLNALIYVFFILGMYWLVKGEKKHDWVLLVAIHSAVFLWAPAFGSTMLWLNGACNYLWVTTLALYALLPFVRQVKGEEMPGKAGQILFPAAALLAGNGVENTSVAMLIFMGFCLGWLWVQKKRIPIFLWVSFGLALAGCVVLVRSPGMALGTRSAGSLGGYLENFKLCMSRLLENKHILYAYLGLVTYAIAAKRPLPVIALSAGFLVCGTLANVAMVVPDYYPHRADFGWIIFWLVACGLLIPSIQGLKKGAVFHGFAACLAATALLTYFYVLPMNYNRFRQAEAQRDYVIQQRDAGIMDVEVFSIKSLSAYDVYADGARLSSVPTYWANDRFAKYYGVATVTATEDMH